MSSDFLRFKFDEEIRQKYGVRLLSGSDEVGRGAMAGPIVVASVVLDPNWKNKKIKDSKLLSFKQREELFQLIKDNCLSYSIKEYDNNIVDKYNPKKTSIMGIIDTIYLLDIKPDMCLIDAEKVQLGNSYTSLSIIKGDDKSQSIACASILAKVYRDRILIAYKDKYKDYGFENHKGYCTKEHITNVKKYGVLPIHRKTYKPIRELLEVNHEH
ncbi:ribonuclease HII [Spiroplasma endosymbiont of Aspidapion aeneum]|uniref:ribonuclease HII n=1 Tax=Spiroplasma endosymbiont of Aspidapion aeneum TaxID=3066276 RepID=UPI00313AD694